MIATKKNVAASWLVKSHNLALIEHMHKQKEKKISMIHFIREKHGIEKVRMLLVLIEKL